MSRPSVVQHRYAPLPALDALAAARPPAPLWRVLLSGSRRHWLATLAAVALLGLVVVNLNHAAPLILASNTPSVGYSDILKKVLRYPHPPTLLRDQLVEDVQYITGMYFGGQANQLLAIINLLYIAKHTGRVAILPMFTALHFGGSKQRVDFAYDLARLYDETRVTALSLPALKRSRTRSHTPPMEKLPCWSTMEIRTSSSNWHPPTSPEENGLWLHGLEPTFWAVPHLPWTKNNYAIRLSAVIDFARNATWQYEYVQRARAEYLPQKPVPKDMDPNEIDRSLNVKSTFNPLASNPPTEDDQLMCLDATYFMGEDPPPPPHPQNQPLEFLRTDAWREIGQYMHFNREVEQIVDGYLPKIFSVRTLDDMPPFITIHMRRGDFHGFKGNVYTPLEHYDEALREVRQKIQETLERQEQEPEPQHGSKPRLKTYDRSPLEYEVLVATDEDPTSPFRQEIAAMGWFAIDHNALGTKRRHGEWYLPLIDGELLSRGQGFVGTTWSTYSLLAGQRVEFWRGGPQVLARSKAKS